MPDATRSYPEPPSAATFLERCPNVNEWISAVCAQQLGLHRRSLADLAHIIGVPRPQLSRWKSPNGPRPHRDSIVGFCAALDIDPAPVLKHYGYTDDQRRKRLHAAIAALEEILNDEDLTREERTVYEGQVLTLMELAVKFQRSK
jgi:transcriptional regulator with XRE-family HTH domain